jgi:hypothetical protein
MALFASEAEVYDHLGRFLKEAAGDDELWAAIARADAVVQVVLRQPNAVLTVKAVPGDDRQVELGPGKLQPDVVLRMPADTLHRLLLCQVNPTVALARDVIVSRGPAAKVLELVPLTRPLAPRYGAHLQASGREDLVRA